MTLHVDQFMLVINVNDHYNKRCFSEYILSSQTASTILYEYAGYCYIEISDVEVSWGINIFVAVFISLTERVSLYFTKLSLHDEVIKWKHFPRYWPFVRGSPRSPVNSPHKDQWRGALMFSLICVWINGWLNNPEAGDLRRYRPHYDFTAMHTLGIICSISNWADKLFYLPLFCCSYIITNYCKHMWWHLLDRG